MKTECYYKIINNEGLFSTGGYSPHFSKKGKIWKKISHLKAHLNQGRVKMYYSEADCKIIKYDMQIQEDENFCISLKDMIQKIYDDDLKKEKE